MTSPVEDPPFDHRHVTLHLSSQKTVEFTADQAWPRHGDYSRFGNDLASFAEEISRRLRTDGYVGFSAGEHAITLIPLGSIQRIDFSDGPASAAF
jgi:hypothetical protein